MLKYFLSLWSLIRSLYNKSTTHPIFKFSCAQHCLQSSAYFKLQAFTVYFTSFFHNYTISTFFGALSPYLLDCHIFFSLVNMELLPPQPEIRRENYTIERVRDGIAYAEQRMRSTSGLTPNITKLLATYKSACQDFLIRSGSETGFQGWTKTSLIKEIRAYEENMSGLFWLTKIDDEETHSFQASLLKIRRYHFYARYGDYARKLARKLRITAFAEKDEDWELLSREYPWKKLSKKLREERLMWKKHGANGPKEAVQTTRCVRVACMNLGADFVQMEEAIHTCGDRNEAFQTSFGTLLEKGEYRKLAETISADLNDLSSIFPVELKHEETLIRAILLEFKDRWFQIEQEDHPFYPPAASWEPTKKLKSEHIIHEHPATKKAAKAHNKKMVVRMARRRLRALKMVKGLAIQPQLTSDGPPPPAAKLKRQAIHCLRKRRQAWHAIAASARKYDEFNSSLALQRIVNTVVSSLRDGVVGPSSPVPSPLPSPALTPATSIMSDDD